MGRLLRAHPCPVCNYHVDDAEIYQGGGLDALYLRNRYYVGICRTCHNLASVLVARSDEEMRAVLVEERAHLAELEKQAAAGLGGATRLLSNQREAMTVARGEGVVARCDVCGSANVLILTDLGGEAGRDFDTANAWAPCPQCEEGTLLLETVGHWR